MEDKVVAGFRVCSEGEFGDCRNRDCELEMRNEKAEERGAVLEIEYLNKKNEFDSLACRFRALEMEKIAIECELGGLKKRNVELEEEVKRLRNEKMISPGVGEWGIGEESDEEEKVQLMIENTVLDCEKRRAESEVEVWKSKCRELESRVLKLQDSLVTRCTGKTAALGVGSLDMIGKDFSEENGLEDDGDRTICAVVSSSALSCPIEGTGDPKAPEGTFLIDTLSKKPVCIEGRKRVTSSGAEHEYSARVRKQLEFGEERSPSKKIAPSTPGGARPSSLGVIDISDTDDEQEISIFYTPTIKKAFVYQSDEDAGGDNRNFSYTSNSKRKRASKIVASDSESDDDNIPICKLRRKHLREPCSDSTNSHINRCSGTATASEVNTESATPRRRLVKLSECEVKDETEKLEQRNLETGESRHNADNHANDGVEADDIEEEESETEDENLAGFIVDSSDVSDCNGDSGESEDISDGNVDFGEVLSQIRRKKDDKSRWEFEGDMLAAFGRDPVLCMKAVCALYRQQTSEEKSSKGTIYANRRGFSHCDAHRGTTLAEFLTEGDPTGDLMKSVEELEEYDPKGIELCRTLATHYSKQLFAIYKNKEDPFFLPD